MATYRDPVRVFAPLEIIERILDAYGFDVYSFDRPEAEFRFGDYRAPVAPGGDHAHESPTTH
jgi:hypothetical protein